MGMRLLIAVRSTVLNIDVTEAADMEHKVEGRLRRRRTRLKIMMWIKLGMMFKHLPTKTTLFSFPLFSPVKASSSWGCSLVPIIDYHDVRNVLSYSSPFKYIPERNDTNISGRSFNCCISFGFVIRTTHHFFLFLYHLSPVVVDFILLIINGQFRFNLLTYFLFPKFVIHC